MRLSKRIDTLFELESLIDETGFLPLFKNPIAGFSVEDMTEPSRWFDGQEHDPWQWSRLIAGKHSIAYGKFFQKRAGFISLKWLPYFVNARRDGYDFDALYDDGKAPFEHKRIMDLFSAQPDAVIPSNMMKIRAGFSQKGGGSFDAAVMTLQMQTYLCICGFERKRNKRGEAYGWPVAEFAMPESVFTEELVKSRYDQNPEDSSCAIAQHAQRILPELDPAVLKRYLR